ncbi:MAG: 16S rRNA (adenine(1518)-N(6)/adenine(1519)-N(6))-dimethyltransferase RsmA [Candidatus Marinimicrobia bacterium]|nr:16S rRNA (adenine(1518)-N(6)/adenine(1519)-N(6))-dimethyltransferase RsmA [Candidatus Neomarinimicrobiota bacterium]
MKHRPKKSLGQHFLTDKNMIAKIMRVIDVNENDTILEIGPGEGALTHELLESTYKLTSLELDTELAKKWQKIAIDHPQFQCIECDAVSVDWSPYLPVKKCVGNIPYNISRPLIYKLFQYRKQITETVFMVQKEFAEKLVAQAGENAYGILSVLSASFADVEVLFNIPPSVFYPAPKVMSACVKLTFKDIQIDDALFIEVVQTAFNQRRKTLRNSLKKFYTPELEDKFPWGKRADGIVPEEYLELVEMLKVEK